MSSAIRLTNQNLLRDKCYINGEWMSAASNKTFHVDNPATGEVIALVPKMGTSETRMAIEAADRSWAPWKSKTAKERAEILRCWYNLIMENHVDLANLLTSEQGKPLSEAMGEVAYGASFIDWFAEEGRRIYGDTIPEHKNGVRLLVLKQPVGVVASITPWNFPIAMITRKCAPALAAGCPVVIKPAEATPLSALALAYLAEEAGFPAGTMNVLTGDPEEIGLELTSNKIVRKLSFTGSTAVGKLLMERSAATVKKVSMELGGNAPFIVFDDADLDAAVAGAIGSKFRNAGQTCVCANRIYVQENVYDAFCEKFLQAAEALVVGDGQQSTTTVGPLINKKAVEKVARHIDDALSKGAVCKLGGKLSSRGDNFMEVTVLTEMTQDMLVAREETFGPLAGIFRFKTEEEAIAMANDTEFGLAAYFYARDVGRVWRVGEALEYGMVGVNDGVISTEVAPFGGVKESGVGREGSKYGIEEFLEVKYMCLGGIDA